MGSHQHPMARVHSTLAIDLNYMPESDVDGGQILTFKVDPHTGKVKNYSGCIPIT